MREFIELSEDHIVTEYLPPQVGASLNYRVTSGPLGGAAGRRAQQKVHALGGQDAQDGVDDGRLAQNGALRPKSVNESGSEGLMGRYKPWVSVCLR